MAGKENARTKKCEKENSFALVSNFSRSVCYQSNESLLLTIKFFKMDEFVLIFRHEDASGKVSPEQIQTWMKMTMDWLGGIAAQNKLVSNGNGLSFSDSRVVKHKGVVTNGPFGEIKETIGGYVIVKAESVEEAVEFAKGSPVLMGEGNSVEVRKVAKHDFK